jgi:coatomer protein complex subunit alpha (xenin)
MTAAVTGHHSIHRRHTSLPVPMTEKSNCGEWEVRRRRFSFGLSFFFLFFLQLIFSPLSLFVDTMAREVDTFLGHFNNISCVIFHPRQDLILSNSEDKTIRVWDIQRRTALSTYRREYDRFWVLAYHREQNLFAAGHDNGMIVFKLERERPPYISHVNDCLFYVKDKVLRLWEYATGRDMALIALKKGTQINKIRSVSYSPEDKAVLFTSVSVT